MSEPVRQNAAFCRSLNSIHESERLVKLVSNALAIVLKEFRIYFKLLN